MFDSLLATTLNHPTPPANISARISPPAAMGQRACIVGDKATYPPTPFQLEWGVMTPMSADSTALLVSM